MCFSSQMVLTGVALASAPLGTTAELDTADGLFVFRLLPVYGGGSPPGVYYLLPVLHARTS
jgi:hypothetical protein